MKKNMKHRHRRSLRLDKLKKLTEAEYAHFTGSYVRLTPLKHVRSERINIHGFKVRAIDAYKYNFTKTKTSLPQVHHVHHSDTKLITIDNQVPKIVLKTNCLNLKVTNDLFTPRKNKNALMLGNDDLLNKSIIKKENGVYSSPACSSQSSAAATATPTSANKAVSFNNTFYITPISPRVQNSYENTFKEYLKKMNGSNTTETSDQPTQQPPPPQLQAPEQPAPPQTELKPSTVGDSVVSNADENEDEMEVEMLEDEPPRRGRGRPRGSGRIRQYIPPPPPRDPNSPPKRRGWPLGLPRKKFTTYKNVHRPYGDPQPPTSARRGPGRPRKILAFGFQTIVTDIKSVNLPSELWSAHVSVTSKRAQVCFTRVVQNKANNLPVECDRSVKFNGTVKYLVRINNRDVALIAAPPSVNSIKDIEILLNIVNDISQNDPVLEYFNR